MAGYVPDAFRAVLLEALVGKTAISTATLYLGLAVGVPDVPTTATLSNITEVTTAGYARKSVPTWDAATTTAPVQTTVSTLFSFTAFTADQVLPITHAFLTASSSGTATPIRYLFALASPILPAAGVPIDIPASSLIIE